MNFMKKYILKVIKCSRKKENIRVKRKDCEGKVSVKKIELLFFSK